LSLKVKLIVTTMLPGRRWHRGFPCQDQN
jgi:hypothetical protein